MTNAVSQIRPFAQASWFQTLGCWRIHNRFAKSHPHRRLDIMSIKPPMALRLVLSPAMISFVSVLPPFLTSSFLSLSPAESTDAENSSANLLESTDAITPGVGGPARHSSLATRFPPLSLALIRFLDLAARDSFGGTHETFRNRPAPGLPA